MPHSVTQVNSDMALYSILPSVAGFTRSSIWHSKSWNGKGSMPMASIRSHCSSQKYSSSYMESTPSPSTSMQRNQYSMLGHEDTHQQWPGKCLLFTQIYYCPCFFLNESYVCICFRLRKTQFYKTCKKKNSRLLYFLSLRTNHFQHLIFGFSLHIFR